ncbi:hypothetical protein Taro_011570 [Colocasia esculenta]|uniref:Uncharacterized protein n=1 Tax=Colocasia esculenta TaxID=4460 RepID=A0A843UCZ8_COLES|nr:hypothetical protein [Colocasia esculenta]
MASRGRRGGAPAREDEQRREEQAEQRAAAPQGPVLPPPRPVDYRVFMQGLVQVMQTQAHTQATLQAQLEAQKRPVATFQRQDKKKAVYQTQQRSVAVGSTQVPSQRSPGVKKECPHCGKTHVLAESHLGVNPRPLSQCQRPDLDVNTNSGVQRYGRQLLWPACAAELQASETRYGNHWGMSPNGSQVVKSVW